MYLHFDFMLLKVLHITVRTHVCHCCCVVLYLAEVLFFVHLHFATYSIMACPSSVPAVSQEVHLTLTGIFSGLNIQTQDDTKKKETIQEQELANGIERKKPFKSKCQCPVHLGTGKRFGMNTDGTAMDPPKVAVYLNKTTDHVYGEVD